MTPHLAPVSRSLPGTRLTLADVVLSAPVLALGAYFKNTPCLLRDGEAVFGPNVGDLDRPEACADVERVADALLALADESPAAIAHDLHPDFHSSRVAAALASRLDVPAVAVQHHHAHVETVLVENGWLTERDGAALGLALDGVGLGSDGSAWGGELLSLEHADFRRIGHLRTLPMPGGDRAAREPWRMAAAVLHLLGRDHEIARRFPGQGASARLSDILARAHLCPRTTSLGRWFDAAAGLLGLCEVMAFEAEAAMTLERAAAEHGPVACSPDDWSIDAHGVLDLSPVFVKLADERNPARGAARFHAALVDGLDAWVLRAARVGAIETVALSGGCFLNRILSERLGERLRSHGLRVLNARRLSPGDAALALGQARIAALAVAAFAGTVVQFQGV